ncbi:MAG: hypothetical protein ACOX6S_10895 [Clostridia bacterium]
MKVGSARKAAIRWVNHHASGEDWFRGAYFSGSTVGMPDDQELPVASDLDVVVVTAQAEPPLKLGKFIYQGALLEVTFLPWDLFASAEEVLASYHLAGSFRVNTVIADPTGYLEQLQRKVSHHFSEREWVLRRCRNVRQKIEGGLQGIDPGVPFHQQVMAWLFSTGITTHLILVAALRNPTVRLRYLRVREVLEEYGFAGLYPRLLELLGCLHMTPQQLEQHLDGLTRTFDATAPVARTPFLFSTDISPEARPIAIDGSRELIRAGNHREAVFWMLATFTRCHTILAADAPELGQRLTPDFHRMAADLGIRSSEDIFNRAQEVLAFLPKLWETAEAILEANPDVV